MCVVVASSRNPGRHRLWPVITLHVQLSCPRITRISTNRFQTWKAIIENQFYSRSLTSSRGSFQACFGRDPTRHRWRLVCLKSISKPTTWRHTSCVCCVPFSFPPRRTKSVRSSGMFGFASSVFVFTVTNTSAFRLVVKLASSWLK